MSVHGPLGATPQTGALDLRSRALVPAGTPPRVRSAPLRTRLGALGLGGVLVSGTVISIAAAHTDNLLPESTRPVPSWLAGPFGSAGLNLHPGGLIAAMTVLFACYVLAVRAADGL